jgi:hypothetical protein
VAVLAMDAKDFRKKAELCLRLADGLSLLMALADDFSKRAKELEAQTAQQRQQPKSREVD